MTGESPQLETSRLLLRPVRLEDFDAYAALACDPEAAHFLGGVQERSAAWRGFMTIAGAWSLQECSLFSAISKETGEWIGRVGPWFPEGWPGTEIGWGIVRRHWNRGYSSEAASASIDWAFGSLGWDEVVHVIDPDNAASQAVAGRLGSSNRWPCRLPAPYESAVVELWGQTKHEWLARSCKGTETE